MILALTLACAGGGSLTTPSDTVGDTTSPKAKDSEAADDTAPSPPATETWTCDQGDEASTTYNHTFDAQVAIGTAPAWGMWLVFDPAYLEALDAYTGGSTPYKAAWTEGLTVDGDGHIIAQCAFATIGEFSGFAYKELLLVPTP